MLDRFREKFLATAIYLIWSYHYEYLKKLPDNTGIKFFFRKRKLSTEKNGIICEIVLRERGNGLFPNDNNNDQRFFQFFFTMMMHVRLFIRVRGSAY